MIVLTSILLLAACIGTGIVLVRISNHIVTGQPSGLLHPIAITSILWALFWYFSKMIECGA